MGNNYYSDKIIDVFYENGIHATFFVVGIGVNSKYAKTLNNAR